MARATESRGSEARREIAAAVLQVHLHHIVAAISCLHHGVPFGVSRFSGTPGAGFYEHANGEGDHHVVAWGPEGLVALEHNHEDAESEWALARDARDPGRYLAKAPASLSRLVLEVTSWGERLATGAAWLSSGEGGRPTRGSSGSTGSVGDYFLAPEVALRERGWLERFSVSRGQGAVALRLAQKACGGRAKAVSRSEEATLLRTGDGSPPDVRHVEAAVRMLAAVGLAWPDAVTRTKLLANRPGHAEKVALFRAIDEDDLEGVRSAIAAGASPNAEHKLSNQPPWQLEQTALVFAIQRLRFDAARVLLDAGANPSRVARRGTGSPLRAAASTGSLELCLLVLERGADLKSAGPSALAIAVAGGHLAIVRMLLDRGVSPRWNVPQEAALVELLARAGETEWLARLDLRLPDPHELIEVIGSHLTLTSEQRERILAERDVVTLARWRSRARTARTVAEILEEAGPLLWQE